MSKPKKSVIEVHGTAVSILSGRDGDYISLTDMLQAKDGEFFISDWPVNDNYSSLSATIKNHQWHRLSFSLFHCFVSCLSPSGPSPSAERSLWRRQAPKT